MHNLTDCCPHVHNASTLFPGRLSDMESVTGAYNKTVLRKIIPTPRGADLARYFQEPSSHL